MQFAIVGGQRLKPAPKLYGACPHCSAKMVSKCGRVKLWHWAHKTNEFCDPWWENETEWHRKWKNCFPDEWQEIGHSDQSSGERHIADVKTPYGLVVEFQNSPMSFAELMSRESFYGNMIWIVNGCRNDLDRSFFSMGMEREPTQTNPLAYSFVWWSRGRFFENWSHAKSRVFIDFGDEVAIGQSVVWRLIYFDQNKREGAVAPYPKHLLVEAITKGDDIGVSYLPMEIES